MARKANSEGRIAVGKDPFRFSIFTRFLAEKLMAMGSMDEIVTHCTIMRQWNVMCRVGNVSLLCHSDLNRNEDAVAISSRILKCNHENNHSKDPRHASSGLRAAEEGSERKRATKTKVTPWWRLKSEARFRPRSASQFNRYLEWKLHRKAMMMVNSAA